MSIQAIKVVTIQKTQASKQKITNEILVGKDILELLTGAMYVDPLSVYREYIQNAADSIDDATTQGLYDDSDKRPRIEINIDQLDRTILLRDNGIGIGSKKFKEVLTSIGGSQKRGTMHRGFRGVGRLSGLGYCQEMTFRSRGPGDEKISELTWDGRRLKTILNDANWKGSLMDAIKEVVSYSSLTAENYPPHFFEVELKKVIRYKNDVLLNSDAVRSYIAQVCPVSFHPDFQYGVKICNYLNRYNSNETYLIYLNDEEAPIYRPYRNSFHIKEGLQGKFHGPKFYEFEGINGEIDAIGWLLEHEYYGAIPKSQGIHGIRFRSGNIQVGPCDLVAEDAFPESRFNSWTVGEVHVLNRKIAPNGRRDNFEQNAHYANLVGKLVPIGKSVAKKCRDLSSIRNRIKEFDSHNEKIKELSKIIKHTSTPTKVIKKSKEEMDASVDRMKSIIEMTGLPDEESIKLKSQLSNINKLVSGHSKLIDGAQEDALACLTPTKRMIANDIFELIYELSPQKNNARLLIDKITNRLKRKYS